MIAQDEPDHGFHNGNGSGENAGVVAPFALQQYFLMLIIDGVLGMHDGGRGFEGGAHDDVLSVGDAALDTPGVVGVRAYALVFHVERVVVGEPRVVGR